MDDISHTIYNLCDSLEKHFLILKTFFKNKYYRFKLLFYEIIRNKNEFCIKNEYLFSNFFLKYGDIKVSKTLLTNEKITNIFNSY